jgi:hypothetical protein
MLPFRSAALGHLVPANLALYCMEDDRYQLKVPSPRVLAGTATRHHPVSTKEWQLHTPRHEPSDDLFGHLQFALKWEGVNLESLPRFSEASRMRRLPLSSKSNRQERTRGASGFCMNG